MVFDNHFNAGNSTADGTEYYINAKDFENKDSLSFKMADEIYKATSRILGIRNRKLSQIILN